MDDRIYDVEMNEFYRHASPVIIKDGRGQLSFDEATALFREIGEEFVKRAGINEVRAFEARRRTAEQILMSAWHHEEPFEVCEKIWNELVELGFSDILREVSMACFYADRCMSHEHAAAGLTMLDPIIAKYTQFLSDAPFREEDRPVFETELDILHRRREGLLAYQISEAEGAAWEEREEARREALRQEDDDDPDSSEPQNPAQS